MDEGVERLKEPQDQEVCCKIMSSKYEKEATLMNYPQYDCINKT